MNATERDPEVDALLGAYALDAVDDAERARVEAYLMQNPSAQGEVDDLRESAAALAALADDELTAPAGLWGRIESSINTPAGNEPAGNEPAGTNAPAGAGPATVTPIGSAPTRRSRTGRVVAALAVAAAVAAIAFVGAVVVRESETPDPTDLAAEYDVARSAQGAREAALVASPGGPPMAEAVVLPDGSGFLKNDEMTALPAGRTYQLWAVSGSDTDPVIISAGVLGAEPKTVAFHADGEVKKLVITVEDEPGVVKSAQPALAAGDVA